MSNNTKAKTWLITGASSGLGYTLAEYALQQGDSVALGARSQAAMTALAARYPDRRSPSRWTSRTQSNAPLRFSRRSSGSA